MNCRQCFLQGGTRYRASRAAKKIVLFPIASSSAFAQMMLCWLNQSWNKKILVNPIISHKVLDLHKLYMGKKRNPIECQAMSELHEIVWPVKESLHLGKTPIEKTRLLSGIARIMGGGPKNGIFLLKIHNNCMFLSSLSSKLPS